MENLELPKDEQPYKPSDLMKDPQVQEFLNLNTYLEYDLKKNVLVQIQNFIMDLGKGFCFVAKQKSLAGEANKQHHIDLVFYNYILHCFVLIDFKIGPLTSEDVALMDRSVSIYDDRFKPKDDNPTYGIIICSHNNETEVTYALLNDRNKIFNILYQLVMPVKEELARIVNDAIKLQNSINLLFPNNSGTGNN